MLYVAMFDEMDEGTAIFKCSNQPPCGAPAKFLGYEGVPSDHYLWLTGQAGQMLRGEIPLSGSFRPELPERRRDNLIKNAAVNALLPNRLIDSKYYETTTPASLLPAPFCAGARSGPRSSMLTPPSAGWVSCSNPPARPSPCPTAWCASIPCERISWMTRFSSFPLTIISHRLGELFWLDARRRPAQGGAWNQPAAYDQEKLTPYYYSTRLDHSLVQTEFTPTERCGYFRFTFPSGKAVVLLANRLPGELAGSGSNVVTGSEQFQEHAGLPVW